MKHLLLVGLFILSGTAFARGDKGNGGVIVKCAERIQLADFYEAKILHKNDKKFLLNYSEESVDIQIKKAFKKFESFEAAKIAKISAKDLYREYKEIFDSARFIDASETSWQFTDDLGPFKNIPEGCKLDNVIHYFRDGYIDVREDYYNDLTEMEKAAIWVHEVLYKRVREYGENTSHVARRTTAMLFSNVDDPEVASGLILGFYSSKPMVFYNRVNLEKKLRLQVGFGEVGKSAGLMTSKLHFNQQPSVIEKKMTDIFALLTDKKTTTVEQRGFDTIEVVLVIKDVWRNDYVANITADSKLLFRISKRNSTHSDLGFMVNASGTRIVKSTKYVASEAKTFNYLYGRF